MSIRPFRNIKRKKTKIINVGNLKIGGDNPISVQSMTNTLTQDVASTIKQINEITDAEGWTGFVQIKDRQLRLKDYSLYKIPVVADIHFHYKEAVSAQNEPNCLESIRKHWR